LTGYEVAIVMGSICRLAQNLKIGTRRWQTAAVKRLQSRMQGIRIIMESYMSVSGISSQRAITQPPSKTPSAFSNDGTSASSSASSPSPQTSGTGSSTQVTFSPDAQALAELRANGVTVATVSLVGLNTSRSPGESDADYIQQLNAALKSRLPFAQSTIEGRDGIANGFISQSDFETVLAQFGDNKSDADNLFAALDEDHDGSVSNAEWLSAVRETTSAPGDSTAQSLLKLMDSNGDGTVSSAEFTQLESTMIAAEKVPAEKVAS
jgi:hypothetical protein